MSSFRALAFAAAALVLTAAADRFPIQPFGGDIPASLAELDNEIFYVMIGTCHEPERLAEVRALQRRHDKLRADFVARSHEPAPFTQDITIIEGDSCVLADGFDDRAAKLRKKLAATRKALDAQYPS